MIAIIDYDAGNLRSVEKAVAYVGGQPLVTRDPGEILSADHVILPGVGFFGDAVEKLQRYGLIEIIREVAGKGTPLLGICLGLQLFFEHSEESPGVKGLALLPGAILRIPDSPERKVPQIGWNSLKIRREGDLYAGIDDGTFVYFVHSYYLKAADPRIVTASVSYGVEIHASVQKDNVCACQFHPEKSGERGLKILRNFINM